MATVRDLVIADGAGLREQGEVLAKLRLVEVAGEKFVQIDTYGSVDRQEVGKQSQSIRLSKSAFDKLIQVGSTHF